MKIRIGTAGWNERPDLYPAGINTAEGRLGFYSSKFQVLEDDGSYYGIRSPERYANWAKWTADGFKFNVKAFRPFTNHKTALRDIPQHLYSELPFALRQQKGFYYNEVPGPLRNRMWDELRASVQPLRASRKLGIVLFQFPAFFVPERSSLRHIEECREQMEGYPIGIEVRNYSWFVGGRFEKLTGFLKKHDILYVAVDSPQGLRSSTPPVVDTSRRLCVVRFHGRNAAAWEMEGLEGRLLRCFYWYQQAELELWTERMEKLESYFDEVHFIMNTNQAGPNAEKLFSITGEGLRPRTSLF